tara:strand:+ start:629 stop:814 length:186 start_codon:yes stop_codon:yes gene_type:complete
MPNPDINLVYHLYSLSKEERTKEFIIAKKVIEYIKKSDKEKLQNKINEKEKWYYPYLWWWV